MLPAAVLPEDSLKGLGRALQRQWNNYRLELDRCQRRFSNRSVHESRVAARRQHATHELLAGLFPVKPARKLQRALKAHLSAFNDLRDTQVQLQAVGRLRRTRRAARPFGDYLLEREQTLARQTQKRIARAETRRLAGWLRSCREAIKEHRKRGHAAEANASLLRAVNRAFARAVLLRAGVMPDDGRTIHRARIGFKKFRYMVEALAPCLAVGDDLLQAMRRYQGMMGKIQDAEMLIGAFDRFLRKYDQNGAATRAFRLELLRRRQRLIQAYLKRADHLFEFWPPEPKPKAN
jgi:CHAD domain-containing protein